MEVEQKKEINCSVTVMPILAGKIGFIRRKKGDSYAELLTAPGGKVEPTDGVLIEGVPYWPVEDAAIRELKEETGIKIVRNQLKYFCSLTLPNGKVVISMYTILRANKTESMHDIVFLSPYEIEHCIDFAPGMRTEAKILIDSLKGYYSSYYKH